MNGKIKTSISRSYSLTKNIFLVINLIFFLYCSDKNPHSFDTGITPIYASKGQAISSDCKDCHKEIYQDWESSRHRVAFTNALYKESHAREPLQWCENCHSPLVVMGGSPDNPLHRLNPADGVSCVVCHVRDDKILISKYPKKISERNYKPEHNYKIAKEMDRSEFCGNCHQFNFPVGTGRVAHDQLRFSDMPMQNTYNDWTMSYFADRETCQDCHMSVQNGRKNHNFPGGHNRNYLKKSLDFNFKKFYSTKALGLNKFVRKDTVTNPISSDRSESNQYNPDTKDFDKVGLEIIISGKSIGHGFPTGDLFRRIVIRFLNQKNQEISRTELSYEYAPNPSYPSDPTVSFKTLAKKNIIPYPIDSPNSKFIAFKEMSDSELNQIKKWEASLQYISDQNRIGSNLREDEIRMIFDSGELK